MHCSASGNKNHDSIDAIDQWHRKRGWDCVGYHFFIRKSGQIEIGRDTNCIPAAQKGYNTGGLIAICLSGLL